MFQLFKTQKKLLLKKLKKERWNEEKKIITTMTIKGVYNNIRWDERSMTLNLDGRLYRIEERRQNCFIIVKASLFIYLFFIQKKL